MEFKSFEGFIDVEFNIKIDSTFVSAGGSRFRFMARFRIWIFQTRDSVLFCDLIEVRSKNIEVVLNLMPFKGEEVDVPIWPNVFNAH